MRQVISAVAVVLLVGACSDDGGGDDGPRPLGRIDGPAQVDPDYGNDPGTDDRSGTDG